MRRVMEAASGAALVFGLLLPNPALAAGNDDLVGTLVSQTFSGTAASVTAQYPGGGLTTSSARQGTATVVYDAARKSYTVTANGKTQTFGAGDIDSGASSPQLAVYKHSSPTVQESLSLTRGATSGRFTYQYVSSGYWQRATTTGGGQGTFDSFVYGMPTAATAVPKSGSASYAIDILGAGTTFDGAAGITGSGTLDVAFGTGKFLFSAKMTPLYNSLTTDVLMQAQGTLGSDKTFRAPIAVQFDPDKFSGTLEGRFFGPQAQEVGGAWSLTQVGAIGAVNSMVGTFMGRRGGNGGGSSRFTTPASSFSLAGDGFNVTQTGTKASRKAVSGVDLQYAAGTDTYAASRGNLSYSAQYYERVTTLGSRGGDPGQGGTALFEIGEGDALQFVRAGNWSRFSANSISADAFVFGYRTANVPLSGLAGYDLLMNGVYMSPDDASRVNGLAGNGTLIADLGAGRFTLQGSANITYVNNYSIMHAGTFKGSGKIAANTNTLTGPITFTFSTLGTIAGRTSGHFFGPKAEEVGLALGATGSVGSLAGSLIGTPSEASKASARPVADYSAVTTFALRPSFLEIGSGDSGSAFPKDWENQQAITWDPAKQRYTVPLAIYYGRNVNLLFGPKQAVPASSSALYNAYALAADGRKWTAQVYKQGSTEIALTYTSFMRIASRLPTKAGVAGNDTFYWLPFGSRTAPAFMPRTGKASYALAIRGDAVQFGEKREHLALTGSGLLKADFATQQLAMSASFTGTTDAAATVPLGTMKYTGWINGSEWGASTAPARYINTARGHFYGLTANEVGGIFLYENLVGGTHVIGNGVMVGKRN